MKNRRITSIRKVSDIIVYVNKLEAFNDGSPNNCSTDLTQTEIIFDINFTTNNFHLTLSTRLRA